jgi:hypothetical protein
MQPDTHATVEIPGDLLCDEAKLDIGGGLIVTMPCLKNIKNPGTRG